MAKYTIPDLRIMFLAAYDKARGRHREDATVGDVGAEIGVLFYPTLLPRDYRRMGGMMMVNILTLDERLERWSMFGGPAFDKETRRMMVADVLACAHMQADSVGRIHQIVAKWFPQDHFEKKIEEATIKAGRIPPAGGVKETDGYYAVAAAIEEPTLAAAQADERSWAGLRPEEQAPVNEPSLQPPWVGVEDTQKPPSGREFSLEKAFGVRFGDKLRETYGSLYAIIHGTIWQMEADGTSLNPGGVNPLQQALYKFSEAIDPLFKGELAMQTGEG